MKLNYSLAVFLLLLSWVGCLSSLPLSSASAQNNADATTLILDKQVMFKWTGSCPLCHVTGDANVIELRK